MSDASPVSARGTASRDGMKARTATECMPVLRGVRLFPAEPGADALDFLIECGSPNFCGQSPRSPRLLLSMFIEGSFGHD